jgi:hypothetical protein
MLAGFYYSDRTSTLVGTLTLFPVWEGTTIFCCSLMVWGADIVLLADVIVVLVAGIFCRDVLEARLFVCCWVFGVTSGTFRMVFAVLIFVATSSSKGSVFI